MQSRRKRKKYVKIGKWEEIIERSPLICCLFFFVFVICFRLKKIILWWKQPEALSRFSTRNMLRKVEEKEKRERGRRIRDARDKKSKKNAELFWPIRRSQNWNHVAIINANQVSIVFSLFRSLSLWIWIHFAQGFSFGKFANRKPKMRKSAKQTEKREFQCKSIGIPNVN